MNSTIRALVRGAALAMTISVVACTPSKEAPDIVQITPENSAQFWSSVDSVEPIGEATVQSFEGDSGTTVLTTQMFALKKTDDGGPGKGAGWCVGMCKPLEGKTMKDCPRAGSPNIGCEFQPGGSCTPLNCGASCYAAKDCASAGGHAVFAP